MKFIKELILKCYAMQGNQHLWRLEKAGTKPHHGAYHPNKPGTIPVVFDLSAEFRGTSINKALLSAPDLTNQRDGVLLRFREEHIAVTGDIEEMYHQAKVPENQKCFLQLCFWKDSNCSKIIVDHEITTNVFGQMSNYICNVKKYG